MSDAIAIEIKSETGISISREEIVKMFDLPERKTKIDTILKLHQEQEQPVYCLCQSSDISKFMIGCEKCDEWYHGDCIGLEERDAHLIKKWYCFDCIEKYGLKVVYFPHDIKKSSHKKKKEKKHKRDKYPYGRRPIQGCGKCSNCLQNEECGNKGYRVLSPCRDYENEKYKDYKNEKYQDYENKKRYITSSDRMENEARKLYKEIRRREKERRRLGEMQPGQCHGLDCTNLSRVNSKYCSDKCGLALAKTRLMIILPSVMHQNKFPSMAQSIDSAKLNDIILRKNDVVEEMARLDCKEKKLMEMIERAKQMPIVELEEETEYDSKSYCVTCGWEVPARSIMRHMESCFRKFESQTAVEGFTKLNSDFCHIFCDHYNAAKKTFCMRLRYVCPVHYKPRKAGDNEVCGCPMIKPFSINFFLEPEKFCQKPKKNCSQHYNWEILAMSDIDLERQRQWNKLNILYEQEAKITNQVLNRSGVLGHLLHSTQVHE